MRKNFVPCGNGTHTFGKTKDGRNILAEVNGPMTILEGCLKSTFKLWRKNPPLMRRILASIGGELLQQISEFKAFGVKIISYADPVGSEAILGPKTARALAEDFLLSFLGTVETILDDAVIMHICPQTAYLLVDLGFAEWRPVKLNHTMTYGEACLASIGRAKFIGQMCLKNKSVILENDEILELCINKSKSKTE